MLDVWKEAEFYIHLPVNYKILKDLYNTLSKEPLPIYQIENLILT